jgi:hypothetical protein
VQTDETVKLELALRIPKGLDGVLAAAGSGAAAPATAAHAKEVLKEVRRTATACGGLKKRIQAEHSDVSGAE